MKQAHSFQPCEERALELESLELALAGRAAGREQEYVNLVNKFHARRTVGVIVVVYRLEEWVALAVEKLACNAVVVAQQSLHYGMVGIGLICDGLLLILLVAEDRLYRELVLLINHQFGLCAMTRNGKVA